MRTQAGMVNMNTLDVDEDRPGYGNMGWDNLALSAGIGFRFAIVQFPFKFYFAKRFVFDGSDFIEKTKNGFDLVISIAQTLN
jgi:outer membrane protein assembly factor BamA